MNKRRKVNLRVDVGTTTIENKSLMYIKNYTSGFSIFS